MLIACLLTLNEYLARFKVSASAGELGVLESYKTWTQKEKAKLQAGFKHISTKPESQPASAKKAVPASLFVVDSRGEGGLEFSF